MENPINNHPTRAEQLDILATIVADHCAAGDSVLDLGCGTGYVAHLIADKRPGLAYTGVDLKAESLAAAADVLDGRIGASQFIEANLEQPQAIAGADGPFRCILSALTFHDLTDAQKQALLDWAAQRLADDGIVLIYDRLRLTSPGLFPAQQSIWRRIEAVHGRGMRTADNFAAYADDLGPANQPAALADYLAWFDDLGLDARPVHLHGNVALIAAARAA